MKKLLFLFSITSIIAGPSLTVIACGSKPNTNPTVVDQELLNSLKSEVNKKFDKHFIKNNIPFIDSSKNSIKYRFFNKENLEKLYANSNDGEIKLNINSLNNIDSFKNDLQNFANLQDLANDINSLKTNAENNYSVFLSNVSSVYAEYDFGEEITIKKQTDSNNNTTYSGNFEVKFKWQYYTQSINTEKYDYKGSFTISDDEELIANIIGISEVGKKFYADLDSSIHFTNSNLNISENESWKDVSQNISNFYKVEQNLDLLLNEIKEYTNNEKFEIIYDKNSLLDDLKMNGSFQYTNSTTLSESEANTFNNLIFKAKTTDSYWNEFFNLETNLKSYKDFEKLVNDFSTLWLDDSVISNEEITNYLSEIYSYGQFKLNNLQLSYSGANPINLGPIILPFTYKSSITTINSKNVLGTSVQAKKYLKNLLTEFHQKTKIVENDAEVRNTPLATNSSFSNNPLWNDLNLDFQNQSYNSFYWKDYNESLKKLVVNNENNILKFEGNNNSYVYKWSSEYFISDASTTKHVVVNLGYFKYKFYHKGAIFYVDSSK